MRVDVIGAGPAGLMAAEVLAGAGHEVRVFDRRRSAARKFVLAGRGGLNITHSEPLDSFLDRYGPERVRLEDAIRAFTPDDVRDWFADMGHPTFVGTSGRVFPNEMRAVPFLRTWLRRLDGLGVEFHYGHDWLGWSDAGALRFDGDRVSTSEPDATVLALGGASWPRVGSDGSWAEILAEREIEIRPLAPANCGVGIDWSAHVVDRFAGMPLKNVAVVVDATSVRGEPVITATGLEGGPIYAHSRRIRERLETGSADLALDLFPDLDRATLERRLTNRRSSGDSTATWLRRSGFGPATASLLREATRNAVPSDPAQVAHLAKALTFPVTAMAGIERAISTAGGVAWSEVDAELRLVRMPNVIVVGEMIDWEAPTGGYLLQACLSTGRWAARALCDRAVP